MARNVVSPNSTGPQPQRPHPDLSTERGDPRRPYDRPPEAKTDGRGFLNTTMGGAGGMDKDSQRPPRSEHDNTRQFARDEVERHLREHQNWKR
jgi:hypothetical protein